MHSVPAERLQAASRTSSMSSRGSAGIRARYGSGLGQPRSLFGSPWPATNAAGIVVDAPVPVALQTQIRAQRVLEQRVDDSSRGSCSSPSRCPSCGTHDGQRPVGVLRRHVALGAFDRRPCLASSASLVPSRRGGFEIKCSRCHPALDEEARPISGSGAHLHDAVGRRSLERVLIWDPEGVGPLEVIGLGFEGPCGGCLVVSRQERVAKGGHCSLERSTPVGRTVRTTRNWPRRW